MSRNRYVKKTIESRTKIQRDSEKIKASKYKKNQKSWKENIFYNLKGYKSIWFQQILTKGRIFKIRPKIIKIKSNKILKVKVVMKSVHI